MTNNKFSPKKITFKNIDTYLVKNNIHKAITKNCVSFKGVFLDLGCGEMPYKSLIFEKSDITKYIGLDLDNNYSLNKPDLIWNGTKIPMEDNSVDCVMATELLEHCHDPQIISNEIYRVLKHKGVLFFTVPYIWPLHDIPYDEYRYTPYSLQKIFSKSGFTTIKIEPMGGWNMALAQFLGLYIKRSSIHRYTKRILYFLLFIPIKILVKKDKISSFQNNSMYSALYGNIVK